jgi:hypothetical protein
LPPTTRFQVLVYNRKVEPLLWKQPAYLTAGVEQRQQVAQALKELRADGSTEHGPALASAIRLQPDVIFLVTDADDLTEEQVREATRLNAGKSVIHTIELNLNNRQQEHRPLQQLARRNGGRYQAVDLNAQTALMPPPARSP